MQVGKSWCVGSGYLTISLTSLAEPGSTEQVDASVLEEAACEMSNKYSGAARSPIRLEYHNERLTRSQGKNTCEAPEIAAAI
jgi:hypothetical protein